MAIYIYIYICMYVCMYVCMHVVFIYDYVYILDFSVYIGSIYNVIATKSL